jgi:kynurenine formamidase
MKIYTDWNEKTWEADLQHGVDISINLVPGKMTPNCFYAPFFEARPFRSGDFIGSVEKGAPVNFLNLTINPHGNGTHTECAGHITALPFTIHKSLKNFHFFGELISVYPRLLPDGDKVITRESLEQLGKTYPTEVLVLRTLPNHGDKSDKNYSGTNPPYLEEEAVRLCNEWGVKHLILDLPSVDREEDGGRLAGHKAFWKNEKEWFTDKTITEMVYIPDTVPDGLYLVLMSIISLETDASPSKIVLYPVTPKV